jgi:hypothetical protein
MSAGATLPSLALAPDDRFAVWIWVAFILFPLLARAVAKLARSVARSIGTSESRDERRRGLQQEYSDEAKEYEERGREAWRRLLDGSEPELEPEPEAPVATLPPPAPRPRARQLVGPAPPPPTPPVAAAAVVAEAPLGGALMAFAELESSVFAGGDVRSAVLEPDGTQPSAPAWRTLTTLLRDPEGWRTAFVLHEVLGPPRAFAALADVPAHARVRPLGGEGRP